MRPPAVPLQSSYWPADDDSALLQTTTGSVLVAAAARAPNATALVEGTTDPARRRWTYAELLGDAQRVAGALLSRFEPGDRIAVWAANCPEWVLLQFGLGLAGMVMVTVNPAYRAAELKYVLEQSRARGLFHQATYRGNSMSNVVAEVMPQLPGCEHAVCFDTFATFLGGAEPQRQLPRVAPADPAMIQYTSGTTGFPKGALLHHFGITNNARMAAYRRGGERGTVDLTAMPLFHAGGCVVSVLGTAQTAGTLVLMPEFDAHTFLDLVEQERAQFSVAVPTMLIALLETMAAARRDVSSLEIVVSGGATVPVDLVNRFEQTMNVRLSIIFGQTETSPIINMTRPDDSPRDKSESLGQALPHTEIRIIDPESGATVPIGTPGELCTRGYLVMDGYFDMPQATAATIDREGWLHTGDLCSMDARGFCYIEGRLKDMIIRGGENIYPREIEERLFRHPAIADVAVVGIPDERWGEQVGAFIRLNEGCACSAATLHAYMREHLAPHKTPKLWVIVPEFPLTQSGKIQKFKLVEQYRNGEFRAL